MKKWILSLSDTELENYYAANEKSFILNSNIVKALFIKLPVETPDIDTGSEDLHDQMNQDDLQQLETLLLSVC